MYSKSLIFNVLGMQVYRTVVFYLWRVLRIPIRIDPKFKPHLESLFVNGYIAIPNFFGSSEYKKIYDEYFALLPQFEKSGSPVDLPHVDRMDILDNRVSEFFRNSFCRNALIRGLVAAYLNRNFNMPYEVDLTRIYLKNLEEMKLPQNGGTNNWHFDAPLRTLKAFYYVTDTAKENAALQYCVGSNKRNTLRRLWLEYKLSIRYAYNKRNPSHGGEYKDGEPWVVLTDAEMKGHDLKEMCMEVEANTLVIVDIGGFHKRGEFSSIKPRDTVELNFRNIDTIRNELYPIERQFRKKLPKFDHKVRTNVA